MCVCTYGWLIRVCYAHMHMRSGAGLQGIMLIYILQSWQVHTVWKRNPWHLDLQIAKSCRLTPHIHGHTHMHRCTNTHTVSPPLPPPFPSSLSSVEFKSKMNLSVTGRLQLQEKHTFQHLGSGRECKEEKRRTCWDSRRRAGSKGGAVVPDSKKLVCFNVHLS